jgi:hypothetical protein
MHTPAFTIVAADRRVRAMAQAALRRLPLSIDPARLVRTIRRVQPRAPRSWLGALLAGRRAARAYREALA